MLSVQQFKRPRDLGQPEAAICTPNCLILVGGKSESKSHDSVDQPFILGPAAGTHRVCSSILRQRS
jgi:hypothetical protein